MNDADDEALKLSREDLYELAWSKPTSELAKDFGISDVALAKRCRKLGIPIPGRGYWARVDAGQSPYRPKLPVREPQWPDEQALTLARSTQALRVEKSDADHAKADDAWLAERQAFEDRIENLIEVSESPRTWDPTIQAVRDEFEIAAREMREAKKLGNGTRNGPRGASALSRVWRPTSGHPLGIADSG